MSEIAEREQELVVRHQARINEVLAFACARNAQSEPREAVETVRISMQSPIGMHRIARSVAVRARSHGLDVEYHHDGGWLSRNHWLRMSGNGDDMRRFLKDYEMLFDRLELAGVAQKMPRGWRP